jgi:hypothetical protein
VTFDEILDAVESPRFDGVVRLLFVLYHQECRGIVGLDLERIAYLDYLLEYPVQLERLIRARGVADKPLKIEDFERESIEAQSSGSQLKPWNDSIRRAIAWLFAIDFIEAHVSLAETTFSLTLKGRSGAESLASNSAFAVQNARAEQLSKALPKTLKRVRDIVRTVLPEVVSLLRVQSTS